jgi:GNAT superfamily N-acetyltransferase
VLPVEAQTTPGARAPRRADRDRHAAVLEAPGRVRALALQPDLAAEPLGEARRRQERRVPLPERLAPSELRDAAVGDHRQRRGRAARLVEASISRARPPGARRRLVGDDVQRRAPVALLLDEPRDEIPCARAAARRARARPGGRRPRRGRSRARTRRLPAARSSSRQQASFWRKPVPVVPTIVTMSATDADASRAAGAGPSSVIRGSRRPGASPR